MREMRDSGFRYLGAIPSVWPTKRLKYFFVVSRVTGRPDATVLSLYRDHGIVPKDSRDDNHNVTSLDTSKYKFVEIGDFVINKMKGWQGSMALSGFEGIVSPAYHVFKITADNLVPSYVHYLLRSQSYADEWRRLSTGLRIGQWDLHVEEFLNTSIPVPSLDEQQRIADYLDAKCAEIDRAIEAAEKSIGEYKAYKDSIVSRAVTSGLDNHAEMKESGIEWLGSVPAAWHVRYPKYLFALRKERARTGDVMLTSSQHHGMIPQERFIAKEVYSPVPVEKGHDTLKHVEPGDFIISMRSFQGGLEYSRIRGKMSSAYLALYPISDNVDSSYYRWLFKSPRYIEGLQSTTNLVRDGQALRYANFLQLWLPVPPVDEQRCIADYLDEKCAQFDRIVSAKRAMIADLKTYKHSLIYEVVTGKREV